MPRRKRQVDAVTKRRVWAMREREREQDCCGQKIAYFLEREYGTKLSVPKIYEILAEKYVIRSKWKKNQKRGRCQRPARPARPARGCSWTPSTLGPCLPLGRWTFGARKLGARWADAAAPQFDCTGRSGVLDAMYGAAL